MNSFWFEKIPLDEFDDEKSELMKQLGATKWSSKIQFYRKIREPRDIPDLLEHMKGDRLIWMDDESFILPRKLPKSVPRGFKYRKAATNISFTFTSVYIYGVTNDIVADLTERFLLLKDEGADRHRRVRVFSDYCLRSHAPIFRATFLTPRFISEFVKANPPRQLILGNGCCLSKDQSIALASHPDPLDVGIECTFEDLGRAFVDTLSKRTSDFGTLSLYHKYSTDSTFSFMSALMSAVSQIALKTTSRIFSESECCWPLSSPARRVEYQIDTLGRPLSDFDDIVPLAAIPQAITLKFSYHVPARFHTHFLLASGNLRELGLIYDHASHSPSEAQQKEVLDAIKGNQNLYRLELGCFNLDAIWDELLEVTGSHSSLRTVVFWVNQPTYYFQSQPVLNLHQVERLVAFMKEHIHLDISFQYRYSASTANEVDTIIKPVRLQNRVRLLGRASAHDRPAIFGAALTNWAAGDVSKTSVLLCENTDLLCSLIGQPLSLMPVGDLEQPVETRKRSAPSSPNAKKKILKLEH